MFVVIVVVITNDVVNVINVIDFQWFPSNRHICRDQIAYVFAL
jgi:hypothetical protein